MSSAVASFVLRRSLCRSFLFLAPIRKSRCFSSLSSSSLSPRILAPRTLTRPCPALATQSGYSSAPKTLTTEDKIKRADESLLRVLDTEIECAEDTEEEAKQDISLPEDLPFEIIDNTGDQTVTLKRKFQDEDIQIKVFMDFDEEDDEEDDKGGSTDDDLQPTLSLVVTIAKGAGPSLEFKCNLSSDLFEIESLEYKRPGEDEFEGAYVGPEFSDLEENLQRAFRKYLTVRGIKPALYDYLHEYMLTKQDKEYINWLKSLKEFVGK